MLEFWHGKLGRAAREYVAGLIVGNLGSTSVLTARSSREPVQVPLDGDQSNAHSTSKIESELLGLSASIQRNFTAKDVEDFCRLTGDFNPLHVVNEELDSGENSSRALIVPGLLCISLIPTIFASRYPGALYISQDVRFRRPVMVGDETICKIVINRVKCLKGNQTLVQCATNIYLEKEGEGTLAAGGEARVLIPQYDIEKT